MTVWSTPISPAYADELGRRYREWSQAGAEAHRFSPDSAPVPLYCQVCGCERGGIHHTS
jgi:hypothetical protein